jgi:hypothetical protein
MDKQHLSLPLSTHGLDKTRACATQHAARACASAQAWSPRPGDVRLLRCRGHAPRRQRRALQQCLLAVLYCDMKETNCQP